MTTSVRVLVLAAVGACAPGAIAQAIAIANASFELPALAPGGFTPSVPPGWTDGGGATVGVFHPTIASWGYTASHGNQVAYTNSGILQQTLAESVRAGVEYVLMVDIVRRPIFHQTYKVELLAGDTVVATDDGSLVPPVGGFLTSTLAFRAPAGHPLVGRPLTIRLSGPTQANFDDVRMTTCRVDLDGDGALTVFDFLTFQNFFASGDLRADFSPDGTLDFFDFLSFQNAFDAGCG